MLYIFCYAIVLFAEYCGRVDMDICIQEYVHTCFIAGIKQSSVRIIQKTPSPLNRKTAF